MNQLLRIYGMNPSGTRFAFVHCPHDFGTYLDIRFYYNDEDQIHVKYMMDIETGCGKWDEAARKELRERSYEFK